MITGLTIGDGSVTPQKIHLDAGATKICHVLLPNGTILTSTAGVIDYNYTGAAGNIKLYFEKSTVLLNISNSKYIGSYYQKSTNSIVATACSKLTEIIAPNTEYISCAGASLVTNIVAPKANYILATNCSVTAKAIGDFLLAAIVNNPNVAGTANFGGGANATTDLVNAYLITKGTTLAAVTSTLSTWTITTRTP